MLCFLGHACGYTHSVPKYKPFRDSMQFINYNFSDVSSFSFAIQFFLRAMVLWFCLYLMPFSMFFLLIFRTNPTRLGSNWSYHKSKQSALAVLFSDSIEKAQNLQCKIKLLLAEYWMCAKKYADLLMRAESCEFLLNRLLN